MSELLEVLRRCHTSVERFKPQAKKIGEQNTKASLIEPVIAALGWDTVDPDEVHREYRRKRTDNPVDYALLLARNPRLFVEAKGLGENIDDPRWTNQTISYAAVAGVEWVALTDGNEWRIYNVHAPVPAEQKLFRTVCVDGDIEEAAKVLSLLSRENMADNRIDTLWKSSFDDRQVHEVLVGLFGATEPPSDLVNLVRRRLPDLSPKSTRESLGRIRAQFAVPAIQGPAHPAPAAPGVDPAAERRREAARKAVATRRARESGGRASARKGEAPRSAAVTRLKLADLLDAGLLTPGTVLTARYLKQEFTATVSAAGAVEFAGERFSTPSGAGQAVKRAARPGGDRTRCRADRPARCPTIPVSPPQ